MSSAAVVIMASEPPGGGQQKKLHPLFAPAKPSRNDDEAANSTNEQNAPQKTAPDQGIQQQTLAPQPIPSQNPQNGHQPPQPQASVPDIKVTSTEPPATAQVNAFALLQQPKRKAEPTNGNEPSENGPAVETKRRGRPPKIRKLSPPPNHNGQNPGSKNGDMLVEDTTKSSAVPSSAVSNTSASTPAIDSAPATPMDQPKKLLQFNPKTGTIGSPPKPKEQPLNKSGRPKRKSGGASNTSPPLAVPYPSQDAESRTRFGGLIDSVLGGSHRVFPLPSSSPTVKGKKGQKPAKQEPPAVVKQQLSTTSPATPKPTSAGPAKSTHPFFTGGLAKTSASKDGGQSTSSSSKPSVGGSSSNSYYTSTPCSPKRRAPDPFSVSKRPQFGNKNGMLRVPGARFPAWPWKGAVHVHPEGDVDPLTKAKPQSTTAGSPSPALSQKKSKGQSVAIHNDESILGKITQGLDVSSVIQDIRNANSDKWTPPPPELRLPSKHIMSGHRMEGQILGHLSTAHSSVRTLFNYLAIALSAFDKHTCENLSWAIKYTPRKTEAIIQSGQEPAFLKNWLQALQLVAVDTGSTEPAGTKTATGPSKGKAKRRRKKNKLDGFIVSSDDEDDEGEASDDEVDWSASGRYGLTKSTVVRANGELLDTKTGRAGARLTNTVVISGPPGCGKSAAVFAAAHELGFEIFEIGPGTRRSGRDVIERIGDMTRNHLVQHKNKKQMKTADRPVESVEYDPDAEDAEGDPDPDFPVPTVESAAPSKKQPTMSSFFKPQGTTTTTAPAVVAERAVDPTVASILEEGMSQKQSLILLDEADLLYEEDKQFWTTVIGLIAQSKRPFIITCNDETLLPLQSLRLHAILRFTAPPKNLAVDRLLLIAAHEGHVLQRRAVESLYEARNHDLRAATAELQFWCQMGVGDRRGGFDWFIPRWPDGVDLDECGDINRVISGDTYREGMGWLNNDSVAGIAAANRSPQTEMARRAEAEESLVQQAWNNWGLDMGQWQDSIELWKCDALVCGEGRSQRRQLLDSYGKFADAMSDADLVSSKVFAVGNKLPLDPTQPELLYRPHEDYILGQHLLERTTAAHELDDLRLPMTTAMRCTAKHILRAELRTANPRKDDRRLGFLDEQIITAAIGFHHKQPQGLVPSDTPAVRRIDFALAFDPISVPVSAPSSGFYSAFYAPSASASTTSSASHLDPSVFDRNLEPIALDVAPFVRGILAHEDRQQKERQSRSAFLSEAAQAQASASAPTATANANTSDSDSSIAALRRRPTKRTRTRTTRTAMSALEGSSRSATRRERWFEGADINPELVKRTGGDDWSGVVEAVLTDLGAKAAEADARDAAAAAAAATAAAMEGYVSIAPFPTIDSTLANAEQGVPETGAGPARTNSRRRDLIISSPGGPQQPGSDA